MTATLYLLPNQITESDPRQTLPPDTLAVACRCRRFLAENAKSARAFLKAAGHPLPMSELDIVEIGHAPDSALFDAWLAPVLEGVDTAIVSESGCPGVADPGADIVRRAASLGIVIKPLVGPCSILLTLMASGMNGQRFRFLGYLPIEDEERRDALLALERESRNHGETQLMIETPYRNTKLLGAMAQTLAPETRITVATDITGVSESIVTRTAAAWKSHPSELPKLPTVFAVLAATSSKKRADHTPRASQPQSSRTKTKTAQRR